ncbi:DUF4232 domain-containing protein [Streptomyces sp. NPDC016845]|uniref:DUF4232 domain-containing protein n=1 Tax=Streptomyces sp. NPDC016845 TaxID=3364972 RepID=UPI0037914F0B
MRAQKITLAGIALVAGLSLTACQSGDDDKASGANDSGSTAASSSSSSPQSSSSSSSSSSKTNGSADSANSPSSNGSGAGTTATDGSAEGSGGGQITTGPCKTANLAFHTAHGMGEGDFTVAMKNTGDACTLKGFPGVDLKADSGPGGISAARSKLAAPLVTLKSGEETRFHLHYPRNDSGGSGVDITQLVVTPPNETHSKTLPVAINLPVSDSPTEAGVTVDPVGTGKQ